MQRLSISFAILVLVGVSQVDAAIRTELFDTDPGWTVVGSGSNDNDFGYQPGTSYAGGSTGEGGGRFTRSNFVKYYADTDLGGTITLDQPFVASGKLDFTQQNRADFGYTNQLGHFATAGYGRVGIGLNYDGNADKFYWTPSIVFDDFTHLSAATAFTEITPNVDRTWSYSWDPTGGTGYGQLTAVLDGVSHYIDVTAEERNIGATMNAFGFAGLAGPSSNSAWHADIYFDDLSYSIVPEPPVFTLLFGCIMCLGCLLRSRLFDQQYDRRSRRV